MTVHASIRKDYERWLTFLNDEVCFSMPDSEQHTQGHCARVLLFALLIADKMGLPQPEREALCAAAVFHDSRRQDDWLDVGHGQRAADSYRDYCRTHPLPFDERAYQVIAFHDRDDALARWLWRERRTTYCCIISLRTPTPWIAFALARMGWTPAICAQPKQYPFIIMRNRRQGGMDAPSTQEQKRRKRAFDFWIELCTFSRQMGADAGRPCVI